MLDDEPILFAHLYEDWKAFLQLDKARQWGQGYPQAIQLAEIEVLGRLQRLSGEDLTDLVQHIRELDSAYLKWQREHDG